MLISPESGGNNKWIVGDDKMDCTGESWLNFNLTSFDLVHSLGGGTHIFSYTNNILKILLLIKAPNL